MDKFLELFEVEIARFEGILENAGDDDIQGMCFKDDLADCIARAKKAAQEKDPGEMLGIAIEMLDLRCAVRENMMSLEEAKKIAGAYHEKWRQGTDCPGGYDIYGGMDNSYSFCGFDLTAESHIIVSFSFLTNADFELLQTFWINRKTKEVDKMITECLSYVPQKEDMNSR